MIFYDPNGLETVYVGVNLSITNPLQFAANIINKVQDVFAPEAKNLFKSNLDSYTLSAGVYIDTSSAFEVGVYGSAGSGSGTPDISVGIESGSSGLSAGALLEGTTIEVGAGLSTGAGIYLQQGNIFNESGELIGTEFSTGIGLGSPVDLHIDEEHAVHQPLFDFSSLLGNDDESN